MRLVDKHVRHDRVRTLSLGICIDEKPIGNGCEINWKHQLPDLAKLGMNLAEPESPNEPASLKSSDLPV